MNINQKHEKAIHAHQEGKLDEAESLYRSVLEIEPNNIDINNNLGVLLQNRGKFEEAEKYYKKVVEINPNVAVAHSNLGNIYYEIYRLDEAETSYKKAIALKPDFFKVYNNLGTLFHKINKFKEAESNYKKAIELKPNFAEAHNNLGTLLQKIWRLEESQNCYKKAIEVKPDFEEAYTNLGNLQKEINKPDEAEVNYKKAIELKPNNPKGYFQLGLLKSFKKEDELFIKMQELHLNQSLSEKERITLNFTLGRAFQELNQFEKSFYHYSEGNAAYKKTLKYNIHKDIEMFDQLKNTFPALKKNYLKSIEQINKIKPIFILGMPRSGTTLVEQIISSHSKVTGAGELNYVQEFGATIAIGESNIDSDTLLDFRKKYLKKIKELSKGSALITDKMPLNFRFIGLILSAFPEAKIVHVKRNPAATCWGNYTKHYGVKNVGYKILPNKKFTGLIANGFSYNFDDLVNYYKLYQDLMRFWEEHYNDQIYNLDYEKLTEDQENETKKLIKYLGLDWEESCLSPQDNIRSVHSSSSVQVRQKVYQGSSDKWKKFKPFLNGMLDHLND